MLNGNQLETQEASLVALFVYGDGIYDPLPGREEVSLEYRSSQKSGRFHI